MVNLERNPAYTGHNIPVDSNNYYRGVVAPSYDSLWTPGPDGQDIMIGHGKGGTDNLSLQAGHPNDLYVNGLVKANMIIEGDPSLPVHRQEEKSGYSYVEQLARSKVESGETPLRIYERQAPEGVPVQTVHEWKLIFDSFRHNGTES